MTRFGMMCAALAAGMMIAATANAAEVIGQDDFDSNRNFLSFTQSPSPVLEELAAFAVISYEDAQVSAAYKLVTLVESPLNASVDGNAFWMSSINPPPGVLTWTFDTAGYEDLTFSFDLAKSSNINGLNEMELLAGFDGGPLVQIASTANTGSTTPFVFNGVQLADDTSPSRIDIAVPGTGDLLTLQFRIGGEVPTFVQYATTSDLVFDNLELTGVPEPASMALLGLGGLTVLARRRRRTVAWD